LGETVNQEEIEDQATNSDQENSKTVETDMTGDHKGDNEKEATKGKARIQWNTQKS
jgi:hypothetical protein